MDGFRINLNIHHLTNYQPKPKTLENGSRRRRRIRYLAYRVF